MTLHENNLSELVERMLKVVLQDYVGGTATGGSTTTVADTSRWEADDFFQNTSPVSRAHITATTDGQAPLGEDRLISDFASTGGVITVGIAFSVAPASGDKYVVLSKYTWDELKEAINMAIDTATENNALIEKLDETLELQDDTYEYTLPEGFTHIFRLSQSDDDGDYPDPIPPTHYKILRGFDLPKIHFYRFPIDAQVVDTYYSDLWVGTYLSDGKKLRIEGFGKQPHLDKEQDVCYLNPNYIVYQAAAFIFGARITNPASDYDNNRTKAEYCEAKAKEFMNETRVKLPPDTKKVVR